MAHGTSIDSTAYGIKGGRCLVDGTAYSIKRGLGLIDGTSVVYKFQQEPVFVINSFDDYLYFAENADRYQEGDLVRLATDIDLDGSMLPGIYGSFSGDFDGGNHTISNGFSEFGLFEQLYDQKICNLTIDGVKPDIYVGEALAPLTSVVASSDRGTMLIQNVHVMNVELNEWDGWGEGAGCLVGEVYGNTDIKYCSCMNCMIMGMLYVGGLAAKIGGNVKIQQCCETGCMLYSAPTSTQNVDKGGIVGQADGGTITNCWCTFDKICGLNTGSIIEHVLAGATARDDFTPVEMESGKWYKMTGRLPVHIKPNCQYVW